MPQVERRLVSPRRSAVPRRAAEPEPDDCGERSAWLDSFLEAGPVDVTVCIANWNCRELLRACLESLHDYPQGVRVETVVVDNGSTDGAADLVAREFPEVVLVRNAENLGFSRANNQAAARARGRYLFFLNNDTVVPPFTLGRLVDYLEANPEVGMVGPLLRGADGQPQVSYRNRPTLATLLHRVALLRWTGLLRGAYRRYRREAFDAAQERRVEILMGAAMLVRRPVFHESGRWDEAFVFGGEDMDLSERIARRCAVVYLPSVEVTHYGRVSTRQHIGFASTHMAAGFARYLRKGGCGRWGLFVYKLAVTADAPVQVAVKGVEYAWRRLGGRREKAEKSRLAVRGAWHLLTRGLPALWGA